MTSRMNKEEASKKIYSHVQNLRLYCQLFEIKTLYCAKLLVCLD